MRSPSEERACYDEDLGFETLAIEPSAALIDLAREAAPAAQFRRASAYDVTLVRLFDRSAVGSWLEQAGFEVEIATAYAAFALPRRRVAFYATRL